MSVALVIQLEEEEEEEGESVSWDSIELAARFYNEDDPPRQVINSLLLSTCSHSSCAICTNLLYVV